MSSTRSTPIGVVGIGYVGLTTAAALAHLGNEVVCLDIDEAKVAQLRNGEMPILEAGLNEMVAEAGQRLTFTTSSAELWGRCDLAFIAVDTPPTPSGDADLSRVLAALAEIPTGASPIVVMKSTVPVATGKRLQRTLAQRGLDRVRYVSNPEFLREGSAVHDVLHPDRVVIGSDDRDAAAAVAELWAPVTSETILCDIESAEMIKLASNAFLATKISFINEIANVCDTVGADIDTVARGMGLDPRIGSAFLRAGIGYGGSCFPKDVSALKQLAGNVGYHFHLLASVVNVNEMQKRRVITMLSDRLGALDGKRIALLGLAFKPGTDDMREAPSIVLANRLVAEGVDVVVHDPVVGQRAARLLPPSTVHAVDLDDALTDADAAVIVTEWPEYRQLCTRQKSGLMRRPLVIDGRNMLDPDSATEAGFEWVGIGRRGPASVSSGADQGRP